MIKKSTLTLQILKVERKYVIAFAFMVRLHYIFRVIKIKLVFFEAIWNLYEYKEYICRNFGHVF